MDFAFLKDRYDFELQRKERLTEALTFPVGVLGGLGSLIALMVQTLPGRHSVLVAFFWTVNASDAVAFLIALLYLAGAYHRQTYRYLPLLAELEEWEERNQEWLDHVTLTKGTKQEGDVSSFLRERIIDASDRNTENNDERGRLLFWARTWLFAVLWLTIFAGCFYVTDFKSF